MFDNRNYNGCIDQLVQLRNFQITPTEKEEASFYMALSMLHSDDDEAIAALTGFINEYPASPRRFEAIASCGDYYFTRGNYPEAIKWYDKVPAKALNESLAADLSYRRAYSLLMLGNNVQARPLFTSLVGNNEYGAAAKFYLAYIAYEEQNYTEALRLFAEVDDSHEPGTAAPYYMSQIYFMRDDYPKALNLALKMIESGEVEQFGPEANRIAGESFYNMGHIDRALPYLWKYASDDPDPLPSTLYILGVNEYDSGNYDTAIALLKKAVKAEGKIGQAAWLYLGQSFVKKGNADAALLSFEKAYNANVDPAVTETAFYNYIVARTEGGRLPFAKTVTMLEDFLNRFPRSRYADAVRESLVDGYMSDGDYRAALDAIDAMPKLSETMIKARQRIYFELGSRELLDGKHPEAARLLRRAMEGPDPEIARQSTLWCADANYNAGKFDSAAEQYSIYISSAAENDPNRTLAYYNLGYTRYNQTRYSDAIIDFNHVVEANPSAAISADAYCRIADCLYQQRDFAGAAKAYSDAMSINPEASDYALYQLSVMQGLQGNQKARIASIDRLVAEYSSSSLVPAAILDKAEAYVALGNTDKAIATYKQLTREYSNSSYGRQAYIQLAILQLNTGNSDEAIDTYKKVIYTFPTSEEARVAVDDLKRIYAQDGKLAELNSFLETVPNSPRLTASEIDALAFQSAENHYVNTGNADRLRDYLNDYPHGSYEPQCLFYIAEADSEAGNLDRALEYASQVVLNHPDSEVSDDAMLLKASIEARQGKGAIALDTYRTLEEKAAGSRIVRDARLGIMRTALDMRRYSEVLVATDKLKTSTTTGNALLPEIRFCEATALDRLNRKSEAYAIWEELSDDPRSLFGAKSAVYHAQSLFDNGKTSTAESVVNKFINANSPQQYWQARAFILLSDILRKQGNDFEATEYLRALKKNYPGTEADIFNLIDARLND